MKVKVEECKIRLLVGKVHCGYIRPRRTWPGCQSGFSSGADARVEQVNQWLKQLRAAPERNGLP